MFFDVFYIIALEVIFRIFLRLCNCGWFMINDRIFALAQGVEEKDRTEMEERGKEKGKA